MFHARFRSLSGIPARMSEPPCLCHHPHITLSHVSTSAGGRFHGQGLPRVGPALHLTAATYHVVRNEKVDATCRTRRGLLDSLDLGSAFPRVSKNPPGEIYRNCSRRWPSSSGRSALLSGWHRRRRIT
jgi:hypothetical protein